MPLINNPDQNHLPCGFSFAHFFQAKFTTCLTAFLLIALSVSGFADEEADVLHKLYPWIYAGEDGFRYKSVSLGAINAYCQKNEFEMSIWYEEYQKRFGEVAERKPQNKNPRPEDGMFSGVRELMQLNVTFFLNKCSSEGWDLVGMSQDFFVFEKRQGVNREAKPPVIEENQQEIEVGQGALLDGQAKGQDVGQIVIDLSLEGVISVDGEEISAEELEERLKRVAAVSPNQAVILRAASETEFGAVGNLVKICSQAEIYNLTFATAPSG